ncbi:hypothetical protein RUND412_003317 [Rhizina undulata]
MAAGVVMSFLYTLWSYKLLLVVFYCGFFFAKKVHRYFTSPFRKQGIPGPFLARFTNSYRFFCVLRGTWHRDLVALHDKHGPIVWVAPNELSVSDPKFRNIIYGFANEKKDETFFRKSPAWETGQINDDFSFLFEQDPARARMGKYGMAHFYSEQGLTQLEENFDKAINEFADGLERHHVETGKYCNLSIWSHMYHWDLTTQLACNYSAGFCLSGKDMPGATKHLRFIFDLIGALMTFPITLTITSRWIRKMIVWISLQIVYKSTLCFGNANISQERISEIRENEPNHLLSRFYDAQCAMKKRFAVGNHTDGTTNHFFNLIAGTVAVTSNVVCTLMVNLLEHPEIVAKLRKEIDSLETSTVPISSFLRYDGNKNRLPYLEAVILEGLRVTPSVGVSLTRLVPPAGCYLNDYYIPAGYVVGMSPWPTNIDKSYFGEDAHEFKPERWLGNHPTELALDGSGNPRTMRAYLEAGWMSFGAGARVCAGRHLAQFSLMKLFGKMLRDYDIRLIQKPNERFGLLVEEDGMKILVHYRGAGSTKRGIPENY